MKLAFSWEGLVNWIAEYVPFTASSLIWRRLDSSSKTLLDVGCGPGRPGQIIKRHRKVFTVGTDIFLPYLQTCHQHQTHDCSDAEQCSQLRDHAVTFPLAVEPGAYSTRGRRRES